MITLLNLQYTSYETCNEVAVADVVEVIVMQTPPGITLQLTEERVVLLNNSQLLYEKSTSPRLKWYMQDAGSVSCSVGQ